MKEEQIEQKAEKYAEELIKHKMAKHDIFVKEEAKKEIMDIYIAGAKENGAVWHDLRKNPKDLPRDNRDVYIATLSFYEEKENAFEYGFDSWNGEEWFITAASDVVAWRETPIFEE